MRWLFADPDNRTEAAVRKRTLARIKDWWAAFEDKAPAVSDLFRGKKQWDLPAWMDGSGGTAVISIAADVLASSRFGDGGEPIPFQVLVRAQAEEAVRGRWVLRQGSP